ncbi:MAG TPA: outer membrane lipoprotein chaperone LolA [Usitatibacter sp.]|jgi:chaperone LolA|nr:outer membrane lipoprotein chaperone LolA [Usitatibacter sp.]
MKFKNVCSVVLACVASLALDAWANGLDDFLAFNQATKSAAGRFEQQVMDREGKVVERGSGSFVFARPGKFRWTYDKPHPQLLVGDGTKLWIYDPELQQVTIKRMDKAISSTPAALLAGREDITSLFSLRDAGTANGLEWVEATPKTPDTGFDRVRLGLNGKTLAAMELFDQLGGHSSLRFTELHANAPVPPDAFRFVPPKGADVIEDAPAKR